VPPIVVPLFLVIAAAILIPDLMAAIRRIAAVTALGIGALQGQFVRPH
jgi:hypothetical protein